MPLSRSLGQRQSKFAIRTPTGSTIGIQAAGSGPGRGAAIRAVGSAAETAVPAGYRALEARGRHLTPGLINAHARLFSDGKPLPAFMTGECKEIAIDWFMHGPIGGHGAPQIALISDDLWAARGNVRRNLRKGVTAIKIAAIGGVTDARAIDEAGRPQVTEEEMTAVCEEAHNPGIVVAVHAQSASGSTNSPGRSRRARRRISCCWTRCERDPQVASQPKPPRL